MNAIFLKLQKNNFLILLPIVLFFTYSLAYLIRSVIIVFLNPGSQVTISQDNQRSAIKEEAIKPLSTYEDLVQGNLIRGQIILPNDPKMASANHSEPGVDDAAAEEMIVTGTLSGHKSFARVTIQEKGKEESEEYAIGQKVGGFTIRAIDQHYIVLEKGGVNLKVEIGETPAQSRQKVGVPSKETAQKDDGGSVKKILSREDVNSKLKDPAAIYKDARFGPHLVGGKIEGYKIYQVSTSHIFYSLGARSGDIVKRVNGMPLNDTGKMLELWNSLKNLNKITVDVDRGGKIITYEFNIRN